MYTPLAPLVPLFAAAAFTVSYLVYKYQVRSLLSFCKSTRTDECMQLMYVSISRVETGGRLWRVAINRILFALVRLSPLGI
mgnify:CR=1